MFGEKINNNRWEKTLWVKPVTTITGKNLLVDSFFGLQSKLPQKNTVYDSF